MKDLLMKISVLVTSILAIVGLSYTLVHADSNGKKYTAYDAASYRKVVDSSGNVDALWALCLQSNHQSPSYSTTKDNYTKIINATDKQILNYSDSKGADVKKLKRILYYKATHPDINYAVTQNEYYYQQGKTREYDTTYKHDFQKEQKVALRSAAEDDSKDALINDLMEVDIYASVNSNIQNLITVRVKEKPKEKDVIFSKVNLGGKEIAGAKIQIKQGDRVIAEWTSEEGKSHTLKLAEGEYVFHEESAPEGYLAVTDITFTVDKDGKVTVKSANGNTVKSEGNKLIVTDQAKPTPEKPKEKDVIFSKVNLGGKEIAGAKIQIKQGDRVIAEWTSEEGKSHTLKLAEGEYVFHEESAPEGYLAVTDITFTVDKDGKVTVKSANGNTVKSEGNKLIVTDQAKPTPEKPKEPGKPGQKPQLPNTGEKASNAAVVAGLALMAVTGGLYFASRKNK